MGWPSRAISAGQRRGCRVGGGIVLAWLAATGVVHASTQGTEPDRPLAVEAGAADPYDPIAALAAAGDEAARRQVARDFLRRISADASLALPRPWLESGSVLALMLESAEGRDEVESLVLAVLRALRPPNGDGQPTWDLRGLNAESRVRIVEVVSRSHTPAAVEALVEWMDQAEPSARGVIAQGLVTMTGREDLGQSASNWRAWLGRNRHLTPLAWRTMLVEGQRQRAERLAQRERELVARLTDATRRLYAASPAEQRPAVLASLLGDAEPALRTMGIEFVLRELERGVTPDPQVGAAVVSLLEDVRPSIRQSAAVLVDRIVPDGSAARLTVALRRETEPEVAAVMLRAFRRAPDASAIDAVLGWMEFGPPTSADALRAVAALLAGGFEPIDAQRGRILAHLDALDASTMPIAAVGVVLRLDEDRGAARVRAWLKAERVDLRRAAADALAAHPWAVEDLLEAARTDSVVLRHAADAVARHGPTAAGLGRIAQAELAQVGPDNPADALPETATLASFTPWAERIAAAHELRSEPLAVRAIVGDVERDAFDDGPAGERLYAAARRLLGLPTQPAPVEGSAGESAIADAQTQTQTQTQAQPEPQADDPQGPASPQEPGGQGSGEGGGEGGGP
ncbi:MAG: hypothetical protein RIB58_12820 [Phycisphaerales bacterium]